MAPAPASCSDRRGSVASSLASVAMEPQAFSKLGSGSLASLTSSSATSTSGASASGGQLSRTLLPTARLDRISESGGSGSFAPPARPRHSRATPASSAVLAKSGSFSARESRSDVGTPREESEAGRVPPRLVRGALREHLHDGLRFGRDEGQPWFCEGSQYKEIFDQSAGIPTWHARNRVKGTPRELDYLKVQPCKFSGTRQFANHPLANSVVDKVVFNHDIHEAFGRSPHYVEDMERLLYCSDGTAGKCIWQEHPQGLKQMQGVKYSQGQADRVILGHDIFERPDEHPEAIFGGQPPAAGWRSWREPAGLNTTLKVTGALGCPDGYRRQGKKPKPPSEAGSALSHTHEQRGRKRDDPSSTHQSVINAVVFNRADPKPVLFWQSPEFQERAQGAAGKDSNQLGKWALRTANHVCLREDALSQCSALMSARSSAAPDWRSAAGESLASSRPSRRASSADAASRARSQPPMRPPMMGVTSSSAIGGFIRSPR